MSEEPQIILNLINNMTEFYFDDLDGIDTKFIKQFEKQFQFQKEELLKVCLTINVFLFSKKF